MIPRPPPLVVDDDAAIRRDYEDPLVQTTYPEIRKDMTSDERNQVCESYDRRAHDQIRRQFPGFVPIRVLQGAQTLLSRTWRRQKR